MEKNKFIKFIHIDKKLYNILKNLKIKDLDQSDIYIKRLDEFVKRCKKILDEKNDISALIISLYLKMKNFQNYQLYILKNLLK